MFHKVAHIEQRPHCIDYEKFIQIKIKIDSEMMTYNKWLLYQLYPYTELVCDNIILEISSAYFILGFIVFVSVKIDGVFSENPCSIICFYLSSYTILNTN